MKLILTIGTANSEAILEILDGIKNAYQVMEVLNQDINLDDACSVITVEVEDKDAFVELIKSESENTDLDSWNISGHLNSVTDLEHVILWEE
jgi:glutamate formiminotransferase